VKRIDRSNAIKWSDGGLKMKNISMKSKLIVSALGALMVSGQAGAMFAPQAYENYMNPCRETLSQWLPQSFAGTLKNSKMFSRFTKLPYCNCFQVLTNAENVKRIGWGTAEAGISLAALSRGKRIRTKFFGGILGVDAYNRFFSKQAEMLNKIGENHAAIEKAIKVGKGNSNKLDRNLKAIEKNREIIPSNMKNKFKNFWNGGLDKDAETEV